MSEYNVDLSKVNRHLRCEGDGFIDYFEKELYAEIFNSQGDISYVEKVCKKILEDAFNNGFIEYRFGNIIMWREDGLIMWRYK